MSSRGMAYFPSSRVPSLCLRSCETFRNFAVAAAERARAYRVQLRQMYKYLHNICDNRVCRISTAVPAEPVVFQPTSQWF